MRFGIIHAYDMHDKSAVVKCVCCGGMFRIRMSPGQYERVLDEIECIQDVLPDNEPWERELFLSGMCDECFNMAFGEEDD